MAFFLMIFPQQIYGIFVIVIIFETRKLNLRDSTLLKPGTELRSVRMTQDLGVLILTQVLI